MKMLEAWCGLNPLGLSLARLLMQTLWQSALLLAAVGVLTWLLRKRSAALRHALWVGAILMIPMLPLLGHALTRAGAPQAPVHVRAVALPALPEPPVAVAQKMFLMDISADELSEKPAILQIYAHPWTLVVLLYALGLLRMLGWLAVGLFRLRGWVRRAVPVRDVRALAAFDLARERLQILRPVTVLASGDAPTALTLGIRKPVALLPERDLQQFTDGDLRRIALHECAHIRRRDTLWLRLTLLLRSVFFFQPLLWWACRQAALLAEESCDEAVVASTGDALPYADLLTRLAERTARPRIPERMATGLLFSRSAFVRRMEAIVDESRARFRCTSRRVVGIAALAALLCVTLAVAAPLNPEGRTKTISIEGIVVDEAGKPVVEASLYACSSEGRGFKMTAEGRSGKDGQFRFDGLPARENGDWNYTVYAHKQGLAWGSWQGMYLESFGMPERRAGIADARLTLMQSGVLKGRVLDREGHPITGASIWSLFEHRGPSGTVMDYVTRPGKDVFGAVTTDKGGRFRLEDMPSKSDCRLEVQAEGYATIGVNTYNGGVIPRRAYFHADGKETDIVLAPESRIVGTCMDAKTGKPVLGADIVAFDSESHNQARAQPDDAGSFVITGLSAGTYAVTVHEADKSIARFPVATITLEEGETREGLALVPNETTLVTFRVLDEAKGVPISGAVASMMMDSGHWVESISDARGICRFNVLPGTWRTGVRASGYQPAQRSTVTTTTDQKETRVGDIRMLLSRRVESYITVVVLDDHGRPVPGAIASCDAAKRAGVSDPDGRMTLNILSLFVSAPRSEINFASSDDEQKAVWVLTVDELNQPPARKEITLRKTARIAGVVRLPDGQPAANAEVTLDRCLRLRDGGHDVEIFRQESKTVAGPDGKYELRGLSWGTTYRISAQGSAGSKAGSGRVENVSVTPGEIRAVPDIVLPRAERSVSGRIVDETGKALANFGFYVTGAQTGYRPGLTTGADGSFRIQDVAEELVSIYVWDAHTKDFEPKWVRIPKEDMAKDVTDLVITLKRK